MTVVSAVIARLGPVLANSPAPGDHRAALTAALWCFGSLIIAGVAWAALRAVRDRRLTRRRKTDPDGDDEPGPDQARRIRPD